MGLRPEDARRLGIHLDPVMPASVVELLRSNTVGAPPAAPSPHLQALLDERDARTPAREKHAEAGRRARAQGEAPEEALKALHERYRAEGLGLVRRLETPVKRISKAGPGAFRCVYLAKAGVDFAGWVLLDGRAVPVDLEVKTTEDPRIALDAVEPHQAQQLAETAAAGGLAFVLARVADAWWLVPWSAWQPPVPGRKSLNGGHLRAVGRPVTLRPVQVEGNWSFAPDWLTALRGGDSPPART